jgi:hypothetical protein
MQISMKRGIVILMLIGFLSSCSNDDSQLIQSTGLISGLDLKLCICGCGGYFIEIGNDTYRFNEEFLPENDLDLSIENLPLEVELTWELADCGLITISAIEGI